MKKYSNKKATVRRPRGIPMFNYTSQCCGAPGKKAPCEHEDADKAENKMSESHLGTWRCSKCLKRCKVNRSLNKAEIFEGANDLQSPTGMDNLRDGGGY